MIAPKSKILRNLAKEVKDMHTKNYKTLEEIKEVS